MLDHDGHLHVPLHDHVRGPAGAIRTRSPDLHYSVRFTPTGPGSVAGTLRITPTTVVTLSGTGVAAPTSGKGKKCGKKKGKKSASAAKKRKCGKKK